MAVRDSAGLYLEVLESAPAAGVPIEFQIFDGANPATMLAAMQLASEGGFQPIFCEAGSGAFTIPRDDPKAVHAIPGNLVRCKLGGIDRFAFWIEEPVAKLTSTAERGGETIVVQGRGALAYLERAGVYPPTWPVAAVVLGDSTSADNGSAGAATVVATRPTGVVSGNVLVTVLSWAGGDTRHVTAAPKGWTLVDASTSGTDLGVAVYVRRAGSGERASWTWTFSGVTRAIAQVVRLVNASADVTAYALSSETGTGTAITHPSVGVGLVNGVLLTIAATAVATTFTPPVGLTELQDRAATGRTAAIAYVLDPALGDTAALVSTTAASAAWMGLTLFVPSSATNDWTFAGATFGAILSTLVDDAQARGALPFLTRDFTAETDSEGQPWPDTHELSFHVGTSLLDVFRHLVTLGLEGEVTPDLRLRLFVDRSRHFEATVILRKGRHFLGDVTKKAHGSARRTRALIEGAGGRLVEVPDPVAEADARMGRREGYLELSTSDDPTDLQIAGESTLELSRLEGEAIELPVVHGPAAQGHFEPWVDYREGDWISLDPAGDGILEAHRIVAISAEQNGADYGVALSLNAIAMSREVRLRRLLDAIAGRSNGASGAGSSLSLGGGGGSGGATGKVASTAGDTAGFLFDKLAAGRGMTKALVGDAGAQRVRVATTAMLNPMTAAGDLIVGGVGGTPERLGRGTGGQVFRVNPTTLLLEYVDAATVSAGLLGSTIVTETGFGQASTAGVAAYASRVDHTHGTAPVATPAIVLGVDAAAGSATTLIRSDATIAAFDSTLPSTLVMSGVGSGAGATGTSARAARRDHKHVGPGSGNPIPLDGLTPSATASGETRVALSDHVHPAQVSLAVAAASDYLARIRQWLDHAGGLYRAEIGLDAAGHGRLLFSHNKTFGGLAVTQPDLLLGRDPDTSLWGVMFNTTGGAEIGLAKVAGLYGHSVNIIAAGPGDRMRFLTIDDTTQAVQIADQTDWGGDLVRFAITRRGIQAGPDDISAHDARIYRSATKRWTVDDGAGGAATVNVIGSLLVNGSAVGGSGSGDSVGQFVGIFDGGGAAPAAGSIVDVVAPFTGTLTGWTMLGDVAGSAVVKVGKDIAANFPPTFPADLITASAPPTLTSAARATSSTLTGWTLAVTAGDILRFSLVSASTLTRVTCVLTYSRP